MDHMLLVDSVEKARKLLPSAERPVKRGSLQFIPIEAPQVQGLSIFEVEPLSESEWRGGMNKLPSSMPDKLGMHYAQEIRKCAGTMEVGHDEAGAPVVKSAVHLKEGLVLGLATALLYDSRGKLSAFLHSEPLATLALAGSLVEVHAVRSESDGNAQSNTLYAVLVGIGRFMRKSSIAKRAPNVELICDPSIGCNDGFLTFRVATKHKQGIRPGAELIWDAGVDWDADEVNKIIGDSSPGVGFTTLDSYFSQASKTYANAPVDPDKAAVDSAKAAGIFPFCCWCNL